MGYSFNVALGNIDILTLKCVHYDDPASLLYYHFTSYIILYPTHVISNSNETGSYKNDCCYIAREIQQDRLTKSSSRLIEYVT
jgi:hypothetical protein